MICTTITQPQELVEWLTPIPPKVGIDTETDRLQWYGRQCEGVSLCDGQRACYVNLHDNPHRNDLVGALRQAIPQIPKLVMHVAKFDISVLSQLEIHTTHDIYDTCVAHYLLHENGEHGLKHLAGAYLNAQTVSYAKIVEQFGISHPKFAEYATNDAIWTWQLHELFTPKLQAQGLWKLFKEIEMPFVFVLAEMESTGVMVGPAQLERLSGQLEAKLYDLELKLYDLAGVEYYLQPGLFGGRPEIVSDLNLNSPKQIIALLKRLGIDLPKKNEWSEGQKVEKDSADSETLKAVKHLHPLIPMLLEYRKAEKLLNTFLKPIPGYVDPDGRLRANFNNVVTATGRLSSSRPNLQNLPRDGSGPVDVRSIFVAESGKTLIVADVSGQEVGGLAEVSKDPGLISALYKGQDPHLATANQFYGLGIPDAELVKTHPKYKEWEAEFKKQRQDSKIINFGLAYGKTKHGFAADWGVSLEEAEQFIDRFFQIRPLVKTAIESCHTFLEKRHYVATFCGRRRRFGKITNRAKRQAFNHLIQGAGADQIKAMGNALRLLLLSHPEWQAKIILQVHDEIVVVILEQCAAEAMPLIKQAMEGATPWQAIVPYQVSVSCGHSYSEAK